MSEVINASCTTSAWSWYLLIICPFRVQESKISTCVRMLSLSYVTTRFMMFMMANLIRLNTVG